MLRKYAHSLTVALLVGSLALSACGSKGSEPGSQPAPAPQTAAKKPAVGGTFTWYLADDPDLLMPYFGKSAYGAYVWQMVFGEGGLTTFNEKNEPAPYMATSWKKSDDGLVWTFTLRDDIKWQDGQALTAEDVAWTYNMAMSPDYTGKEKSAFDRIQAVKAVNPTTVQITLKEPYAPFLFMTTVEPILPKHAFPADIKVNDIPKTEFAKKPIGAGPYKFVNWQPGQSVTLDRNADYFESKDGKGPFIQTMRFRVITEAQTAVAALEAGEIDYYPNMEPQFVDHFRNDLQDKVTPYDWDRNGFGYQTFNTEKFPTSEKAVRQALTMGLNKQAILKGPLDSKATVPAGPIPPVSWAYDPNAKGLPYDPAAAKKLLDDAGFKVGPSGFREKDGKPLTIDYYATKGNPLIEAIALQSKKDWSDLGLQVNVNFVDFNVLLEKHMEPGDFNVTFSGFSLGVDPDVYYNIYHSSQAAKDAQGLVKGNNVARYKNPAVDKILEEARRTTDLNQRKQLYSQFEKQIIDDAPNNWIYANKYTDFVSKRVKGVVTRPGFGTDFWWQWYINEA